MEPGAICPSRKQGRSQGHLQAQESPGSKKQRPQVPETGQPGQKADCQVQGFTHRLPFEGCWQYSYTFSWTSLEEAHRSLNGQLAGVGEEARACPSLVSEGAEGR